jgi:hypothetical protein
MEMESLLKKKIIRAKHPISLPVFCLAAAISLCLSGLFLLYFKLPLFLTAPLGAGLLLLIIWMLRFAFSRRTAVYSIVFSALLSLSFIIGGKIDTHTQQFDAIYHSDILYFVVLTTVFFLTFLRLMDFLQNHTITLSSQTHVSARKIWIGSAVFLFLCWLPCLILFYPGNISWDSLACIVRAMGRTRLTNQQPILYILLMRPFLMGASALGLGTNAGAASFLAAQSAATAAMAGYVVSWLHKKGFPAYVQIPVLAYFALNPIIAFYAVTMWKDILFSAVLMVYTVNLIDLIQSKGERLKEPRFFVWFLIVNLLIAFLRNNGYYLIAITLVVLTVLYRKMWKRILPAFLALLVIVPVVQGPVYDACNIGKSPFAESVAIPLQQIGRSVVENGPMTEEQRAFVAQIMPLAKMKKVYFPFTADKIKFDKQFNSDFLEKNKGEFFKVWLGMMRSNFRNYVKAYLMETLGYWHIGTSNWIATFGTIKGYGEEQLGMKHVLLTNIDTRPTSLSVEQLQKNIPILSGLASIGFLFWTVVFTIFMLFLQKKRRQAVAFLPLILLWGTLMAATPTYCEFRYMYAFALAFPLAVISMFPSARTDTGKSPQKLPDTGSTI